MVLAIILVLLVIFTVMFTFFSPWWFTPLASNWGTIDAALIITFWITGVVFVAVSLFMAYAVYKYRHREDGAVEPLKKGEHRAAFEPENKKLEYWLIGITTVGIAGMLAPGLIVWADYVNVPAGAATFETVGQQWSWNFRLPGKDGKLGRAAVRYITYDNPLGVDPSDPNSMDDYIIEGGEIHLPINQPVKAYLRSIDVLHDFYVPQFRAKMDMVPGMVTYFWFTPTRTGEFEILCAELCGVGHSAMRGYVVIDEPADYQVWLGEQVTFAEMIAPEEDAAEEDAPEEDVPEEGAAEEVITSKTISKTVSKTVSSGEDEHE